MEGRQAGVMTIGSKRVLAITVNANMGFVRTSKQALNVIWNIITLVFCRQERHRLPSTNVEVIFHNSYM